MYAPNDTIQPEALDQFLIALHTDYYYFFFFKQNNKRF